MLDIEKSILSTLIYYDILDYPLTLLEIYKYLHKFNNSLYKYKPCVLDIQAFLENSFFLKKAIDQKNGFYFIKSSYDSKNILNEIYKNRIKRQKSAHKKWKKVRRIINLFQIIPYIRMIGITGSLALGNSKKQSDLDFFIITAPNRIWISRILITGLAHIIGQRRYGLKIADRVCLNSYITENSLKIEPENLYSSHEYTHLIPVLDDGVYSEFCKSNTWIGNYIYESPFNLANNQNNIVLNNKLRSFAMFLERILDGKIGLFLEKKISQYQKTRIQKKIQNENPNSQIAFNDNCLMFHPVPKSLFIDKEYKLRMKQFVY
ncbi:MAG: hypothetical protein ABIC36_01080 [bacterium]